MNTLPLLLNALLLQAALALPEVVCPRLALAPVIDGRLDDAAWATVAPLPRLRELGPNGQETDRLEVRLACDATRLYVAARIALPGGRAPRFAARTRDLDVWYDDDFELFLMPDPDDRTILQLVVGAGGARADIRHGSGGSQAGWNPEWELQVSRAADGWSLEAAVPFVALEAAAPARGHVWRVGVASSAAGAANVAWPANQESAFRNPASFAALIFEDRNLAANGDVEAPAANGQAPGWRYAYHPPEGKGVISVVPGGRPGGQQMLDLHKTDDYAWFPQLWSAMLPLQRGSTYRVSLWVKCDWPYLLRHTFFREGANQKQHHPMPAAPEWTRITNEFSAPPEFDQVSVGLMLPQREGHLYADDLTIERVNDAVALGASLPNPDPIHGLRELARRRRFKPYPLLREGDGYQTDRVIFRDTGTGTAVCKVTRSGGVHSRHGYMEMPPWNADGSRLLLGTGQLGKNSLLLPADASAWRFLPWYASSFQWDRLDPELMYYRIQEGGRWTVCRRRLGDLEPERLKTFDGEPGLWPPSPDGQKLLIKENFPAEKPPRSVIWLMDRNGRDFHPMYPPHEVHQTWFTKLPDYSVEYEYEDQAVRGNYRITQDSKVQTITEQTQGHRAHSPDGQWIAGIGRANLIRIDGKETRVLADVGTDHHTWKASNDWYAASSGRHLVRVGADGSFGYQRIGSHNSSIKHSTYSSEAHPEMSADGTKIAYASNMLHDIEFYWHQMGLPAAPTGLTARRQGNGVALTWQRPQPSRELAGYLVYRASASGQRGELLTPNPLAEPAWVDPSPPASAVYNVSAVEHSGLESLLSAEAVVGIPPTAQVVVVEAESGTWSAPAEEAFRAGAAGLFAVQLGASRPGTMAVTAMPPAAGVWRLGLRVLPPRSGSGEVQPFILTLQAGGQSFELPYQPPAGATTADWLWLSQTLDLPAGPCPLTLATDRPGPLVDQLVIEPPGAPQRAGAAARGDLAPPPTPAGLTAESASPYAMRLRWSPVTSTDLHHYNVYASRGGEPRPEQEFLVASPAAPTWVDWGLEAGTRYGYRVTAVDRAGNESPASAPAAASTPPLANRLLSAHRLNLTSAAPASLTFRSEQETEAVIWLRAHSTTGDYRSYKVRLTLDGQPLADHAIRFAYVSLGHGGPVVGARLWDPVSRVISQPDQPLGFRVAAGDHTLGLQILDQAPMVVEQAVITNDLGYLPPGRADFLVEPVVAEEGN